MNVLRQFLRGEVPLVRSYWLFGIVGYALLTSVIYFWEGSGRPSSDSIAFGYVVFIMAYTFVACIGIWRSATKYYDNCTRTGSEHLKGKRVWAILAKISVGLVLVRFITAVLGGYYDGQRLDFSELTKLSIEINQNLPKTVDDDTILQRTYVDDASRLVYEYRVTGLSSDDISKLDLDVYESESIDHWCRTAKELFQQGVTVRTSYIGDDNQELIGYQVNENSCSY